MDIYKALPPELAEELAHYSARIPDRDSYYREKFLKAIGENNIRGLSNMGALMSLRHSYYYEEGIENEESAELETLLPKLADWLADK